MNWSWEYIDREWLAGSRIAVSPDEAIQAFITTERLLGPDWIESRRTSGGSTVSGASPTLSVVVMGQRLQSIEGLVGSEALIARLRQGDRSASAELTSIYLCRCNTPNVIVEIGVDVDVAGRTRKPDFRIRREDSDWTYVEVAAPETSTAQQRAETVLHRIAELLDILPTGSTVEVFLRREPTNDEIDILASATVSLAKLTGSVSQDLPGLALLLLNTTQPGKFAFDSHGEPTLPRLSAVQALFTGGRTTKHIAVRIPFTDERAEAFLTKEAKQLPTGSSGLIMIDVSGAPGAFTTWEKLLRRRLQPTQHTRVSGICLFTSGLVSKADGEAWQVQTMIFDNLHAKLPLAS